MIFINGGFAGLGNIFGGTEIRLTQTERDHVDALSAELGHPIGQFYSGRGGNIPYPGRKLVLHMNAS